MKVKIEEHLQKANSCTLRHLASKEASGYCEGQFRLDESGSTLRPGGPEVFASRRLTFNHDYHVSSDRGVGTPSQLSQAAARVPHPSSRYESSAFPSNAYR